MLEATGLLVLGLVVLVVGGELLVRGASNLASIAGVSPLVIGLTVVAFGTSAPELAVAVNASFDGQPDIAVGNVVGSNIFNVLFILGLSALISPLVVQSQLVRIEVPLMIAVSVLALVLGLDGLIGRIDGIGLFCALVGYTVWSIIQSRKETAAVKAEFEQEFADQAKPTAMHTIAQILYVVVGLVLLNFGSGWLVDGSVAIARILGMSELLIGLTIVAAGTSLPEVVASVVAVIRGERDIAVGNIVGSNLFNIMCVLGVTAAVAPNGIPISVSVLQFDFPVMIAVAVACLPIFATGHLIARVEGAIFFGYYIAYTTFLILTATRSDLAYYFSLAMLFVAIPLTVIVLLVRFVLSMRSPESPPAP